MRMLRLTNEQLLVLRDLVLDSIHLKEQSEQRAGDEVYKIYDSILDMLHRGER